MTHVNSTSLSRRTVLLAGIAGMATRAAMFAREQQPVLVTLTEWINASQADRRTALQGCLDRIKALEPSIHAWVQVLPGQTTAGGRLAGIPYGVKDIVETKGLATEYGSPIYKGRIGTTDAAIIRRPRTRCPPASRRSAPARLARSAPPRIAVWAGTCRILGRWRSHVVASSFRSQLTKRCSS